MSILLKLLKEDLGITHNKRDDYYTALLSSTIEELKRSGIEIDPNAASLDDALFVVDWAVWQYRHRVDGKELPRSLMLRLRNRQIKRRAENGS